MIIGTESETVEFKNRLAKRTSRSRPSPRYSTSVHRSLTFSEFNSILANSIIKATFVIENYTYIGYQKTWRNLSSYRNLFRLCSSHLKRRFPLFRMFFPYNCDEKKGRRV